MTDDFDPTLTDAEAAIAALVPDEQGFVEIAGWCLETYAAEYERRGRVVAVAEALVEEFGDYTQDDVTGRHIDLIRALARAVRNEGEQ